MRTAPGHVNMVAYGKINIILSPNVFEVPIPRDRRNEDVYVKNVNCVKATTTYVTMTRRYRVDFSASISDGICFFKEYFYLASLF